MMSLLWLIVTALGLRLVYEQSYDVDRRFGVPTRKILLYASGAWWACLGYLAFWWVVLK